MSASKYLDYEVALLLAKHGRTALLDAIARKLQLTPEQLDEALQAILLAPTNARSRQRPSLTDLVAQLSQVHPAKAKFLRTLHTRLENRTFLGDLREVKRFFEQYAGPAESMRSRTESLPKVIRLLAELDIVELERLCLSQPEGEYSSLGVISDAILRREEGRSKKTGT